MDKHLYIGRATRPVKVVHEGGIGRSVSANSLGLAQIVGLGAPIPSPVGRRHSDAEALRGDWVKVGGDMYAAMEHERKRAGK